jgi:hypothetical protein
MLVRKAETLALEAGINRVRIDTNVLNKGMQKIISRLGFTGGAQIQLPNVKRAGSDSCI